MEHPDPTPFSNESTRISFSLSSNFWGQYPKYLTGPLNPHLLPTSNFKVFFDSCLLFTPSQWLVPVFSSLLQGTSHYLSLGMLKWPLGLFSGHLMQTALPGSLKGNLKGKFWSYHLPIQTLKFLPWSMEPVVFLTKDSRSFIEPCTPLWVWCSG